MFVIFMALLVVAAAVFFADVAGFVPGGIASKVVGVCLLLALWVVLTKLVGMFRRVLKVDSGEVLAWMSKFFMAATLINEHNYGWHSGVGQRIVVCFLMGLAWVWLSVWAEKFGEGKGNEQ